MHHPSYFCLEKDWSCPCQVSEGEVQRNNRCLGVSPLFRSRGGGGSGGSDVVVVAAAAAGKCSGSLGFSIVHY